STVFPLKKWVIVRSTILPLFYHETIAFPFKSYGAKTLYSAGKFAVASLRPLRNAFASFAFELT
ncbi:MAG: hypothetical protein R2682_15555, partial [Pyrinomonadaceae bacterium]